MTIPAKGIPAKDIPHGKAGQVPAKKPARKKAEPKE